ncbi:MAG: enoyl-CoA hydratase [Gammaproteobacteria bacterium]|nr:enoyl-CoA hydratase [Gammaproteobacteria bacterium]
MTTPAERTHSPELNAANASERRRIEEQSALAHEEKLIRLERDGRGVITLTLNRPQAYNALSEALLTQLQHELDTLETDLTARVLVLAGAGKAFCAGHDLREMRAHPSPEYYQRLFTQCSRVMLTLRRLPIPVIARVHGIATAAGCQLVAQCDLAVAASDARFAVSGVNLGLFCSTPGVPLSRNVPLKQAFEMLVTGDFIDAAAARERGLVNRVVPPEALDAELEGLVAGILRKPRVAIALGKGLFYRQAELGFAAAYEVASRTMAANMMESIALEGVQAFLEKRPPRWD